MIAIISGTNRSDAMSYKLSSMYQQALESRKQPNTLLDLDALPPDFVVSALYENQGKNEAFNAFIQAIEAADKLIFVVPEYNGSFPGVLKAFIDGMPYPNALRNKKIALTGLSAGNQGAALALSHLTDIFHYLGAYVYPMKVRLPNFNQHFSGQALQSPVYRQLLNEQLDGFLDF